MFYPFGYFRFDPTMIILIPAVILTIYAQGKVQSSFAKYLRIPTKRGYTGVQVARNLLDQHGLQNIPIEVSHGKLSDHYDPTKRVLRLSQEVYQGYSIASVSVAAHEVGHAIQHANGYIPLSLRNKVFPVARIGSSLAWPFMIVGLLIPSLGSLMNIGIILFGMAVLFQIITLPVEFNASSRALNLLDTSGFLAEDESKGAKKVLNAAALTYIETLTLMSEK
ncbi:MAG TPA: zinc metallopeptidase [Clostridia bacterium]|nr:zinc metallopeptidase [Clostridia bacterium]HOT70572.1 zinc metallopeptidase [Clostridia bacterium]HQG00137.1 zinc metallopeptidase [Clostridia bacterium]HQH66259.1 zinc metallopeptidase [Clostridia bacterium]HQJ92136.1 zinc metallopeptidase [Clostridia bacterium]